MVVHKKTTRYYYLHMLDGAFHVFRRIEQPPMIIDEMFSTNCLEEEVKATVEKLNEGQIKLEEAEDKK